MSNLHRNRAYIGGGKIYVRRRPDGAVTYPAYPLGNADSFSFAIGEDKKTQRNFQQPGGGNIASQSAITDVTATINALSLQPQVVALALRSLITTITGAAQTDEVQKVFKEAFQPLNFLPDTTQPITVKNSGGTVTYTAGTDYVVERGGLLIPEGSTITASDTGNAGVSIKVTYTSQTVYKQAAISQSAIEYEVIFNGFNDADDGKAVFVKCHRVKFSPTQALDMISEDFAGLSMNFEVLADTTKVGVGESQYFEITMAQ